MTSCGRSISWPLLHEPTTKILAIPMVGVLYRGSYCRGRLRVWVTRSSKMSSIQLRQTVTDMWERWVTDLWQKVGRQFRLLPRHRLGCTAAILSISSLATTKVIFDKDHLEAIEKITLKKSIHATNAVDSLSPPSPSHQKVDTFNHLRDLYLSLGRDTLPRPLLHLKIHRHPPILLAWCGPDTSALRSCRWLHPPSNPTIPRSHYSYDPGPWLDL